MSCLNLGDKKTHIKLKDNSKWTFFALKVSELKLKHQARQRLKKVQNKRILVQFSAKLRIKVQEKTTKSQYSKLALNSQQLGTST